MATRIRESGLTVYGFGQEKTPEAFISACDKFIFTETLKPKDESTESPKDKTRNAKLRQTILTAISATSKDDDLRQ